MGIQYIRAFEASGAASGSPRPERLLQPLLCHSDTAHWRRCFLRRSPSLPLALSLSQGQCPPCLHPSTAVVSACRSRPQSSRPPPRPPLFSAGWPGLAGVRSTLNTKGTGRESTHSTLLFGVPTNRLTLIGATGRLASVEAAPSPHGGAPLARSGLEVAWPT